MDQLVSPLRLRGIYDLCVKKWMKKKKKFSPCFEMHLSPLIYSDSGCILLTIR